MAGEIRLTAGGVAEAMAGTIVAGDSRQAFAGVSIDSRTLRAGELYVGVLGARVGGGGFASAPMAAGAAGTVLARERARAAVAEPHGRPKAVAEGAPVVIAVDDTTVA